jgi:signal transduction histidine kinase
VQVEYKGRTAVLCNLADITDQKRAEAELLESEARLRVLSGRLIQAQESERARIARDLHDGIGQTLTALKFLLENAAERIRAGEATEEALGSVIGRMRGAVEEVRRISMDLRPSTLDQLGILPTIGWFCREFQEACPEIHVERRLEVDEQAVPDVLKITVYRLLQEAMNNAAKHSGATRILVGLSDGDQGLRLRVEDNGRGFPEDPGLTGRGEPGFGLGSMRQRSELTGGTLSLRAVPGGGAAVEVFWPTEALRRLRG